MDPFYWFKRHEISRGISYRAALQPPLLSSLASGARKKKKKAEFAVKFRFAMWFVFFCFFVLFLSPSPPPPPFSVGVTYREFGCFWKLTSIECEVWIDPYIRATFWIELIFIRNYGQCFFYCIFFLLEWKIVL